MKKKNIPMFKKLKNNVIFTRTALGSPIIIHKKDINKSYPTHGIINLDDWTKEQLHIISNYMEANPNCTLYPDGSSKCCD